VRLDLSGKVAIVTGASRGIGRAVAVTLGAAGATVVAAARGSNAQATADAITASGGKATALPLELTEPASVEALSAVFDFNRAPFLQSFLEVRVEGSARRVRLILHGVDGPLTWRDLQTGGAVVPAGQRLDDQAVFAIPMR